MIKKFSKIIPLFFLVGCFNVEDKLDTKISYVIQDTHIKQLSSAFPPLTEKEKETNWGKEMFLAKSFAKDLDLYRAITTYKRSLYMIDNENTFRRNEIEYDILLCYFFGKKYNHVIDHFENTDLCSVDKSFPSYSDLLTILFESYKRENDEEKAEKVIFLLNQTYPIKADRLALSSSLLEANLNKISDFKNPSRKWVGNMLSSYETGKKSIKKAQVLNAVFPGAGYFYLGQKKSAVTALLINSLFIAATYQFFHKHYYPAAIIATSFEMGWYFGGIYGAGEEAKFYNERLYESLSVSLMKENKLYPQLMLKYSF